MSNPTKAKLRINPANGYVYFGPLEIKPETTLLDLGSDFTLGEEMMASVVGKKVKCRFAETKFNNDGKVFELSLRFENEVLVSVFITIVDPSIPVETAEEFYGSLLEVQDMHELWLKEQLGEFSNKTGFDWGKIGVAQDKSDNIYLHNRNNSWVFN